MSAPDSASTRTPEPPVWTPPVEPAAIPDEAAPEAVSGAAQPAIERAPAPPRTLEAHSAGPKRQSRAVTTLLAIGAFVFVAGIGFSVGRISGSGTTSNAGNGVPNGAFPGGFAPGASGDPGGRGGAGGFGGSTTIEGTVESVSNGTMTVKLANGQTVQIATDASTTYHGQTTGSASDVTAGKTVTVQTTVGTAAGPASGATASGVPTRTATSVTVGGQ